MNLILPVVMLVVGLAIVTRTVVEGGGPTAFGILVGALFVAAGGLRIWLARRSP